MKKTEQFDFDTAYKEMGRIFADMLIFAEDRGPEDCKTMLAYIDRMLIVMVQIKKEFK